MKKTLVFSLAICSTALLAPPLHEECKGALKQLRQELAQQQNACSNTKYSASRALRRMRAHVSAHPDPLNLMPFCFGIRNHGQLHLGESCVPCCKAFLKSFAAHPESEYPTDIQIDAEYDPAAGYQQPFLKEQREKAREKKLEHRRLRR